MTPGAGEDKTTAMSAGLSSFGFKDVDAAEKPRLVRGVFDSVARRYDLMNDLMSGGVHRIWKDIAAARLNPQPGETIIDCAGGTGDIAGRLVKLAEGARKRRGGDAARIVVVDYNTEMIGMGRTRATAPQIAWAAGDALCLPLPDACADAYVIGFGIRNTADVGQALREARRVLKPGGRFLCLEFSRPPSEALAAAYDAFSFKIIPRIGERVTGDRESYQYLVESIRRFPDQASFAAMMREAGFSRVEWSNLTGGVAALHQGWALSVA
jgi:demethylmenaquinone methyltransferase/2-methoxy-6-polyprenyl-1,4-benzoquinol methylase